MILYHVSKLIKHAQLFFVLRKGVFLMENEENRQNNEFGLTGHSNSRLSVAQLGLLQKISVSFDRITVVGALIPEREQWV